MKKLLLLIFSLMLSFNSYGEWKKFSSNSTGDYYVDLKNVREHDGYVYYWSMINYVEPYKGFMSIQVYLQGDCGIFRNRPIEGTSYIKPMGEGESESYPPPPKKWNNPRPESIDFIELDLVCDNVD